MTTKPCKNCGSMEKHANNRCAPCRRKETDNWQKANPGKVQAQAKQWYQDHKKEIGRRTRQWQKANPEKHKAILMKRRSRKMAAGGKLNAADIKSAYIAASNTCLKCGTDKRLSIDHIIPLACGGCNSIDNIQILCLSCNTSKHTKTIDYRDGNHEFWRQGELW